MSHLSGAVGRLDFVVEVKRAATGEVETFPMTSEINAEQLKQLQDANILPKEKDHGSNP